VDVVGATGDTLVLNGVTAADAGSYTVVVSNGVGSVPSAAAVLIVNPASASPTITTHPDSQSLSAGNNVNFSVTATGTTPLSYQWQKNGEDIIGATGDTLTLTNLTAADAGSYTVLVSNLAGSALSDPAILTVIVSPIRLTKVAVEGSNIALTWTGGTGPFTVQRTAILSDGVWQDVLTTTERTAAFPLNSQSDFYRIAE
jgi:hypothetical protein